MQILELPALVGILEDGGGLAPLARGCALGGASGHIPAREGTFPSACCSGTHGEDVLCRRDVPRGHSGAPGCDTGHAKEQVGQEELKTLRATGRGEKW